MWNWIKSKFKRKVKRMDARPRDKRPNFTGLEIITHVRGNEVSRCLFPLERHTLYNHQYFNPVKISENELLSGYTIKAHKSSMI
jgi:hypothetical protein